MPASVSARSQAKPASSHWRWVSPSLPRAPHASATSRAPNRRARYGACGFAAASSPNSLPAARGVAQEATPIASLSPARVFTVLRRSILRRLYRSAPASARRRLARGPGPARPSIRSGAGRLCNCSTLTRVTLDELTEAVALGAVDTVVLAMTDMQGRLQGKRLTGTHFLNEVAEHGAEGCNYLLAVDVEMNTVDGYAMSSWERGYGDMLLVPDLQTMRHVPWQEGTVVCLADVAWLDGSDVPASPRQVLRRQLARLTAPRWTANAGTELEFLVFLDTYEEAWHKGYRDLRPANLYNVDYSLLGTARVEPLIRRIRNSMAAAGLVDEDSEGGCHLGRHEINFRYADALRTADEHAIFKNGAKEIAAEEGMALTFMAKFDQREGSSCHIHFSLADANGPLFAHDDALFESFLAGQLACLREMTLLLAPNINSY